MKYQKALGDPATKSGNKDNFVKEDGKIIVYSLENGKVVKIDKISTKEELANFIK